MTTQTLMFNIMADGTSGVRLATRSDRGIVRRIECACFGRSRLLFGLWPRTAGSDTTTWLAVSDGSVAGYLIAYPRQLAGKAVSYVGGVAVLPLFRRRGIARRLTRCVLLRDHSVWLHVRAGNLQAIALYRQLGMCELQRINGFYSNGEDAVVMGTPDLVTLVHGK